MIALPHERRARQARSGADLAATTFAVFLATVICLVAVMAALAMVIFAEKLWRYGKPFGQAVGVVLVAIDVAAIWFPWLLPGLHASGMPAMPTMAK